MSLEELRAAQSRELEGLREEFYQKALAAKDNKEQLERLNKQYRESAEATRQKHLGSDTRALQVQEIKRQYSGEITNTGSDPGPKDVRADVDLAAKSHQAASDLARRWRDWGDKVLELPDGMGYVNKTRDMTLWNPCETPACMEAKIKYHDAFGTEGGREYTKVPGAVEDPRGVFLDNQKKFIHAVGEGDLKTAAKSVDKAAGAAGIKDPNDPFWKQSETLRNYGDPVEAGIADLTDTPDQQKAKVQEWLRQATNRMYSAEQKLPQRTKFDDPNAKTRVKEGNVKADVENIRSRGGMETRGPSVVKGMAGDVTMGLLIGALVSFQICVEEGGDPSTCAKGALSGQDIAEEVFWGAVAAFLPGGPALAAAYGAYHGARQIGRLGEEILAADRAKLEAALAEARARSAQRMNLYNMEAIISRLEQRLLGELEGLLARRAAAQDEACRSSRDAEEIVYRLRGLSKQIDQASVAIGQASNSCKDLESLKAEAKTRADKAKRHADLAERGFAWIREQINACGSITGVAKAIENLEAAIGLARGASQNYSQAEEALTRLREIQRASSEARKRLSAVEGIFGTLAEEAAAVSGLVRRAEQSRARFDELTKQIEDRKAAMRDQIGKVRDTLFPPDATQVDKRLEAIRGRLTAEEPMLSTDCAISWVSPADAAKIRESAGAKVEGLKSIPLCDGVSLPEGEFDDAARAIASMGLGGLGEGLEEQGNACLARLLKIPEKPVAGTGGQGPGKDDRGGSGTGGTGTAGPGQEPLPPPLPHVLSRFGVSCSPNKIKVGGQPAVCQAAGEYSDQPGVIVNLTGPATWSHPNGIVKGSSPGLHFVWASYEGVSATTNVVVVEDEKKGPTDDGGKKPPDIKGATEAGEEPGSGGEDPGERPSGGGEEDPGTSGEEPGSGGEDPGERPSGGGEEPGPGKKPDIQGALTKGKEYREKSPGAKKESTGPEQPVQEQPKGYTQAGSGPRPEGSQSGSGGASGSPPGGAHPGPYPGSPEGAPGFGVGPLRGRSFVPGERLSGGSKTDKLSRKQGSSRSPTPTQPPPSKATPQTPPKTAMTPTSLVIRDEPGYGPSILLVPASSLRAGEKGRQFGSYEEAKAYYCANIKNVQLRRLTADKWVGELDGTTYVVTFAPKC